jgi:F-type H+-transporting ATPase subunit a
MKNYSPLEIFEVLVYKPLNLLYVFDLSLTNVTVYLLMIGISIVFFFGLGLYKPTLIPNWIQWCLESLYKFTLNLVKEQTEDAGVKYFPLFYIIFIFILISNLIGLFPFSFTVTSHFALTFGLALSLNLGILIIGISKNGFKFLKLFVPEGAPVFLLPLIVVIEVVSYLIRTFSLAIRLFANMMAGHTLLHILSTFMIRLGDQGPFWLVPFLLILGVLALELGIVFIQAYVFTILGTIYLNDSYHPGH